MQYVRRKDGNRAVIPRRYKRINDINIGGRGNNIPAFFVCDYGVYLVFKAIKSKSKTGKEAQRIYIKKCRKAFIYAVL